MSISENREAQGVARSNPASSEWSDDLVGVQAIKGGSQAISSVHPSAADVNAFSSGHSKGLFALQSYPTELEGFAPAIWEPTDYQIRGVKWLRDNLGSGLFLPPGFGKTSIVLAAKQAIDQTALSGRMLVIAPLTAAVTTWLAEPKKWRQFGSLKVGLARGPDRAKILQDETNDVVIINYDALEWAAPLLIRGHSFRILVCDELTRLKHIQSKRFKYIKPLLPSFAFRWGLTGTPAANGLLDLFGQIMVLDMGERLGRYITHFRSTYFFQKPWDQYRYYIKDENAIALVNKISDICMYMDPAEHLKLPPLIDVIRTTELSPGTRKQYKVLEHEFILALEAGIVTAANAGVLTSKLRQFTGGAVYHPGAAHAWSKVHDDKLSELNSLMEELAGEPLMVAYQFEHEFERLKAKYPEALYIKGGMSKKQLQMTVETWNTGHIPILLVQPSAAALGLNLQFGGHNLAWFTLTYNLEEYIQLIARLLRKGQDKPVMNYIIAAKDTIDTVVANVLVDKDVVQNKLFTALQQLRTSV